jgi:hypothetical protein
MPVESNTIEKDRSRWLEHILSLDHLELKAYLAYDCQGLLETKS